MAIRFIQPGRIRKTKSQGSQEVLHRLEEYLETGCDEPVEILCGFWRDQQDAVTYQELREAILDEKLSQQALQEWSQDYSVLIAGKLSGMWTDAIAAGASGQPVLDSLVFNYDMDTSGIRNWIRERGAEFVTSCTKEQKNAIAALLSKKMRDAHTVDELARMIRPCIGLTEGQAKANARYYDSIVANLKKEHPRMKAENIRRKARDAAQKYAERQHRERAMTIAQTESAFAYNRGADEGVRQAQEQGLLGKMVKRWSTSGDDAVCAICSALEGTEVGMDESFDFRGKLLFVGQKMLPPAHPRCACAVEYIEVEPVYRYSATEDQIISYDEEYTLTKYVSPDSYVLNEKLRRNEKLTTEEKRWISNIDNCLDKLPTYNGMLTRSVTLSREQAEMFYDSFVIGETYQTNQYLSTTKERCYNEESLIQIYIKDTRFGRDLKNFNDMEQEVLYKRNSRFIVIDKYVEEGKFFITLHEE